MLIRNIGESGEIVNKKVLFYIFIGTLIWFSLWFGVSAKETEVVLNGSLYSELLEKMPFTENSYQQFKEYFNQYINDNLDPSKTYLIFYYSNQLYLYSEDFTFEKSNLFKVNNEGLLSGLMKDKAFLTFYYTFSNENQDISITVDGSSAFNYYDYQIMRGFTNTLYLVWSNHPLRYSGEKIEDTYSYRFKTVLDSLKKYYNFEVLNINQPIYTYGNLLFGDYVEEGREKVNYRVEYYFDDLIDNTKTEVLSGYVGDKISSYQDHSSDLYKLYTENQNYTIVLNENETQNVLKIYYRSPLYGTEKSPIITNTEEFYFFFNIEDIKKMFPSIEFANFTQYEQFIIVIGFNIFFCLFLIFMLYIAIQSINRVWSWIKGFVF